MVLALDQMAGAGQDGKLDIFFWHDCFIESFTKVPYLDDDDDDEDDAG